jgi:hypothetical protein
MTIPCRPSAQWCGNCLDPCPDHDFHALYLIPTQRPPALFRVARLSAHTSYAPSMRRQLSAGHCTGDTMRRRSGWLVGVPPGRLAGVFPGLSRKQPPPLRGSRRATAQSGLTSNGYRFLSFLACPQRVWAVQHQQYSYREDFRVFPRRPRCRGGKAGQT